MCYKLLSHPIKLLGLCGSLLYGRYWHNIVAKRYSRTRITTGCATRLYTVVMVCTQCCCVHPMPIPDVSDLTRRCSHVAGFGAGCLKKLQVRSPDGANQNAHLKAYGLPYNGAIQRHALAANRKHASSGTVHVERDVVVE